MYKVNTNSTWTPNPNNPTLKLVTVPTSNVYVTWAERHGTASASLLSCLGQNLNFFAPAAILCVLMQLLHILLLLSLAFMVESQESISPSVCLSVCLLVCLSSHAVLAVNHLLQTQVGATKEELQMPAPA